MDKDYLPYLKNITLQDFPYSLPDMLELQVSLDEARIIGHANKAVCRVDILTRSKRSEYLEKVDKTNSFDAVHIMSILIQGRGKKQSNATHRANFHLCKRRNTKRQQDKAISRPLKGARVYVDNRVFL